ncbi:hypothetical protein J2S21_000800 [Peribacillus cavernae]|nr:uracil-DNA glycosylase family protein [Peribacillus cavernae]MDQ0217708.1 hypothetical protein [Peribacillus cavernae]
MSYRNRRLEEFLEAITQLPQKSMLSKDDLLTKQFLIEEHEDLEIYYSPHNDYINQDASIVIVGITPGWTQMRTAFRQAIESIKKGDSPEQLVKKAKIAASFSGTMRANLIEMLDECGIAKAVHTASSASLFTEKRHLLHTTSVIRYPVFYQKKNYTGYRPKIDRSAMLSRYAYEEFPEEIAELNNPSLIIPLGKSVEQVVRTLITDKKFPGDTCLFGFPHPSGANVHRKKQFQEHVDSFKGIVERWAEKSSKI